MRFLPLLALALVARPSFAQVTVQQPVVSNIGVTTTVSVPDRGTVLLGGVKRAAASRSQNGFWPRIGSSLGREVSSSNITASVYIHDLHAMDAYLLGIESGFAPPTAPALTARAMLDGRGRTSVGNRGPRRTSHVASAGSSRGRPTSVVSSARRSYELGLRAERAGKAGVARLHFEMAARHGSAEAREKLAERR